MTSQAPRTSSYSGYSGHKFGVRGVCVCTSVRNPQVDDLFDFTQEFIERGYHAEPLRFFRRQLKSSSSLSLLLDLSLRLSLSLSQRLSPKLLSEVILWKDVAFFLLRVASMASAHVPKASKSSTGGNKHAGLHDSRRDVESSCVLPCLRYANWRDSYLKWRTLSDMYARKGLFCVWTVYRACQTQ